MSEQTTALIAPPPSFAIKNPDANKAFAAFVRPAVLRVCAGLSAPEIKEKVNVGQLFLSESGLITPLSRMVMKGDKPTEECIPIRITPVFAWDLYVGKYRTPDKKLKTFEVGGKGSQAFKRYKTPGMFNKAWSDKTEEQMPVEVVYEEHINYLLWLHLDNNPVMAKFTFKRTSLNAGRQLATLIKSRGGYESTICVFALGTKLQNSGGTFYPGPAVSNPDGDPWITDESLTKILAAAADEARENYDAEMFTYDDDDTDAPDAPNAPAGTARTL